MRASRDNGYSSRAAAHHEPLPLSDGAYSQLGVGRELEDQDAELLAAAEEEVAAEAERHASAQGSLYGADLDAGGAPGTDEEAPALAAPQSAAEVLMTNGYFLRVALDVDEGKPLQENIHPDGKVERAFRSGRCQILYSTGTRKEVLPNGVQTVVFSNGDVKQTGVDRRVVYYYAEARTTHVSEPNGTQLYHFPNGQVERHFTDGLKEIKFADGSLKVILPSGEVQSLK